MKTDNLLIVNNLQTHFFTAEGVIRAVDGVSFTLQPGEALGIVGESGSGKSVMSLSLMRLIPFPPGKIIAGEIIFDGQDLRQLSEAAMRQIRGKRIAMIFQDPMTSLNPFLQISRQITEIIELHERATVREARRRAIELLEMVGIPDAARRLDDYPHQFSGGMRQRVMIAMALACKPELLIADEPTTALDVTIQAQILELIKDLREQTGTAVILITHDLGVVAGLADKIAVMYAGKIVETAAVESLFNTPYHPYTQGLLQSVPDPASEREILFQIPGSPPDLAQLPVGCAFAPRCAVATAKCNTIPELITLGAQHQAACWQAATNR
jgi:oligopeptide transport system ATP-binding protein